VVYSRVFNRYFAVYSRVFNSDFAQKELNMWFIAGFLTATLLGPILTSVKEMFNNE
jgi:hypothetical protein